MYRLKNHSTVKPRKSTRLILRLYLRVARTLTLDRGCADFKPGHDSASLPK
jgi:hypothetical protein